jgi:oligopeptide/dipeptide ABC transporter ATP-binding protein
MTSLNPLLTIGRQIGEPLQIHSGFSHRDSLDKAVEMIRMVDIPEAEAAIHKYPHQLSGGMRQRVMIAMALSCNPKILIADEPTTALDVTIQAQVLDLMRGLQERLGTAIILITHDMGVIAENTTRVVVMYAGRKVEEAGTRELFQSPRHPYTKGLLASIPRIDGGGGGCPGQARLNEIPGMVPMLLNPAPGCLFAPRCAYATEKCRRERPQMEEKGGGHRVACWNSDRLVEDAR